MWLLSDRNVHGLLLPLNVFSLSHSRFAFFGSQAGNDDDDEDGHRCYFCYRYHHRHHRRR